jgi:hypothetical protein
MRPPPYFLPQRSVGFRAIVRQVRGMPRTISGGGAKPSKSIYIVVRGRNGMLSNRSIPRAAVIPVIAYPNVNEAAA